jgi:hypothetical protein
MFTENDPYTWMRAGKPYLLEQNAFGDRPDLVERLHAAEQQRSSGRWLTLGGGVAVAVGAALVPLAAGAILLAGREPGPSLAVAPGVLAVSGMAVLIAGLVREHRGATQRAFVVDEFNRDAATHGCHAPP